MFADSFCETSWTDRSRRGWTTLASFGLQVAMLATLLVIPLLYTEAIPQLRLLTESVFLTPPAAPAPPAPHTSSPRPWDSNVARDGQVVEPASIPRTVEQITEIGAPAPIDMAALNHVQGVLGGTGTSRGGVLNGDPTSIARAPETVQAVVRHALISHIAEGNLIHRVQPVYPHIAIAAHIEGTVVLQAVISRDGNIENLQALSGPAVLVPAAIEAVRQWRYRPYYLNHEPVEVETQVTVKFVLAGG